MKPKKSKPSQSKPRRTSKAFLSTLITLLYTTQPSTQSITQTLKKECSPIPPAQYGSSELNYKTEASFLMACNTKMYHLAIQDPANTNEYNWPLDHSPGFDERIISISHRIKEDQIFLGVHIWQTVAGVDNFIESRVYYYPNFAGVGYTGSIPSASVSGGRLQFLIQNYRNDAKSSQIPAIERVVADPDNSFFAVTDDLGQVLIYDLAPSDGVPKLAYNFKSCLDQEISALKFRPLAAEFMVAQRSGKALIHVTFLTEKEPRVLQHSTGAPGEELSAIEVFKFDERAMTGGSQGTMKLWNCVDAKHLEDYNVGGSKGKEVLDMLWVISTNFFVSVHRDKRLNIWRLSGRFRFVEGIEPAVNDIPKKIFTVGTQNSLFIGFSFSAIKYDADSMRCHEYCRTCNGEGQFDCTSCFAGYTLTQTDFCKKYCDPSLPVYYDQNKNDCKNCAPGCQVCMGPRDIDCLQCQTGFLQHPNRVCLAACKDGTYYDSESNTCKYCHPTCTTCRFGGSKDCIVCATELMMNVDKTCTPVCKTGTFNQTKSHCAKCDASCKECNGTTKNSCTECKDKKEEFLSKEKTCVNCMHNYKSDPELCEFVHALKMVRTPYESVDKFSSLTIKIWLQKIENLTEIMLNKIDWNKPIFEISVDGETQEIIGSKRETIRRNSFVIDLNFTKQLKSKKMIKIKAIRRDLVVANLTNKDVVYLQNFEDSWNYPINLKLDRASALYVEHLAKNVNWLLMIFGLIILLSVISMLFFSFDITYLLVDFTRMAKVLHRIKFINVNQTPLVEYFLVKIYNLYQSGLDRPRDEVDQFEVAYRGKLTQIGVSVFPLVNFSDKYVLYLLSNMIYYSFSQVAKYIAVGDSQRAKRERMFMKLIGKVKIMIILMICNDLIFSASRNLIHYNLRTYAEANQSLQYYIISLITLIFICYDLLSITANISNNEILRKLRQRVRVVRLKLSTQKLYREQLAAGLINEDGTKKVKKRDPKDEPVVVFNKIANFLRFAVAFNHKKKKRVRDFEDNEFSDDSESSSDEENTLKVDKTDPKSKSAANKKKSQKKKKEDKFIDYFKLEKENRFSADFEFCSKGIDSNKLIIKREARYYNVILVIKVLLFELVTVSSQQVPVMQTILLTLVQVCFYVFYLHCLLRIKIFKNKFSSLKALIFETALLLYFVICLFQSFCDAGMGWSCLAVSVRRTCLFSLLGVICLILTVYFFYVLYNVYMRFYKTHLVDAQNRIILHDDLVEVVWIDDRAEEKARMERELEEKKQRFMELKKNGEVRKAFCDFEDGLKGFDICKASPNTRPGHIKSGESHHTLKQSHSGEMAVEDNEASNIFLARAPDEDKQKGSHTKGFRNRYVDLGGGFSTEALVSKTKFTFMWNEDKKRLNKKEKWQEEIEEKLKQEKNLQRAPDIYDEMNAAAKLAKLRALERKVDMKEQDED